ncbi:F0F1 ATP synthase subunit B family protein [Thiohalorhabdus sp.]|uniref:F0F1 ATP synthase subunit B family protein n=1 Tax=Thiohalorhabdus sp. TaxID=3094134 RepID=UPI002FC37584
MTIDWLTVVAQVVNFLVLVFLLQHFLYHPVVNAMARREERIANEVTEAERREAAADREAGRFREMQRALDEERTKRLEAADREAEQRRQELLDQARKEVRQAREQWHDDLAREQAELERSVRRTTARAVARIARRVLADLADAELEGRIIERFLQRLDVLGSETARGLREAPGLTVRTAFPLGAEQADNLRRELGQCLGGDVDPAFDESDAILCGIELTGGGHKVAWSVDEYLAELGDALEGTLARPEPG